MTRISAALAASALLALTACGGGDDSVNNVAATDYNLSDEALDGNLDAGLDSDLNAVDVNAVDANTLDGNVATDTTADGNLTNGI